MTSFASIGTPILWLSFIALVFVLLLLDLGVFHRKAHVVTWREAVNFSFFWIGLALVFNVFVWWQFGAQKGLEFFTGYLIEKALSVDNIFVFIVIFRYFAVPRDVQHRVLFFGIIGALISRGFFIAIGTVLISRFHFIIYIFGVLLIYTGIQFFREEEIHVDPEANFVYRWVRRFLRVSKEYAGQKFFIVENGKWIATPLLLVLITIEITDIVFAIDSIPAIFAITSDPFIVFTSNIFAIFGLRALYFLLEGAMTKLEYLRFGLAIVLTFVGLKMVISDFYQFPIVISLLIISFTLLVSILLSLRKNNSSLQS